MRVAINLSEKQGLLSFMQKQELKLLTTTDIDDVTAFLTEIIPRKTAAMKMLFSPSTYKPSEIEIDGYMYYYSYHRFIITNGVTTLLLVVIPKKNLGG